MMHPESVQKPRTDQATAAPVSLTVVPADAAHPAALMTSQSERRDQAKLVIACVLVAIAGVWALRPLGTATEPPAQNGPTGAVASAIPSTATPDRNISLAALWPEPAPVEVVPLSLVALLPVVPPNAWIRQSSDGAVLRVAQGGVVDEWTVVEIMPQSVIVRSTSGRLVELLLEGSPVARTDGRTDANAPQRKGPP